MGTAVTSWRNEGVYFVDHFVNYHETEIGKALSEVLLHNQIVCMYLQVKRVVAWRGSLQATERRTANR